MSQLKSLKTSLYGSPIEVVSPSTNLCDRFVERACHLPNKIAVVFDDQSITYGELYSLVNSLACRLSRIVQPGDIVCQCVERSIEMVVGILAIFMCNTVYCPLNPYDSNQRHRTLLSEVNVKVILVHNSTAHLFIDNDRICMVRIDQDNRNDPFVIDKTVDDPSAIAFLVFTSGSTGTPKGVPIEHKNFSYYLAAMCHERYILESDILLQVSRDTFDLHLEEILGAVLVGGSCVLLNPSSGIHLNIGYLIKIIRNHHITFINLVPSLSIALIDYLSNPKQLLSSFLRVAISLGKSQNWCETIMRCQHFRIADSLTKIHSCMS
jgi:non-ribosomal peptide synthetase component F